MKKFFSMSFLLLMVLSLPALAAQVDTKASEFGWKGTKVLGKHYGKIFLQSATVKTEGDKVTGGEFVMDIASLTVEDIQGESAEKLKGHLKSADFFNVEKFPTAKLVVEKMDGGKATGNLTIKDKTNPVEIAFTQEGNIYSGKFVFDRTKYDMIYGSGSFFKNLGDKVIHNEVELTFKVVVTP